MKKIYLLIISIISLFMFSKVYALNGYTTDSYILVRTGPGTNYNYIAQIDGKYTNINILEETLYNQGDSNCSTGWYKINYNNQTAYICGVYVSIGENNNTDINYNGEGYEARINGTNIYARYGASSSYGVKHTLFPGTNINILSDKIAGNGCSEGYYKVRYYDNQIGYVCSKYVVVKSEITATDAEYEQYLANKGFPSGYIPYLVYLHNLHPNWTFNAINTGLNWDTVVSGESYRNFINSSMDAYQQGVTNESGWYYSRDTVNAFYLDPRNFLTEKFIFMFQKLDYEYDQDKNLEINMSSEIVQKYYNSMSSMLGSSYLNTQEYLYMFIKAGYKYGVSPVHLVARVMQEGGSNSTYTPITGTYATLYYADTNACSNKGLSCVESFNLYGYYNYYNIGAYSLTGYSNPALNGLIYACGGTNTKACGTNTSYGRPWNTREKAIYGGANFLGSDYIAVGQNTLYFEKFNTSPYYYNGTAHFSHQYMTNVTAPCSEAANIYNSYIELGILGQDYSFDIPIYNNMPESISLPSIASTINSLNSIKVNDISINGFDPDILDYTVYINQALSSTTIVVSKDDAKSTVTGDGNFTFEGNETTREISVVSESGSKRTYRIKLVKVTDTTSVTNILDNLSVKVTNNIMNNISPGTLTSTLLQSISKYSPGASVTIVRKNGTAVGESEKFMTGDKITINAPNGESQTFSIAVKGDATGDGEATVVDLIRIQKHILNMVTLTDENLKAADATEDGSVGVTDLIRIQKYILKMVNL